MKLLMVSSDRALLRGIKVPFWYTLEEFSKHWERIDLISPLVKSPKSEIRNPNYNCCSDFEMRVPDFPNVYIHPSPHGMWYQPRWILKKGTELIQRHHHDVITVHTYPPFQHTLGAHLLHRSTKVPWAMEIHGLVGFPHAASVVDVVGRMLTQLYLPFVSSKATAVRVINPALMLRMIQWGAAADRCTVVPSAYLDRSIWYPDMQTKKLYDFCFVGRIDRNKDLQGILRALAKIPNATLVVIGDGAGRSQCEKLAATLKVEERVTFAGWLEEQTDVATIVRSSRALVMHSKSEGGPRVVVEALACSVPVIATRVGIVSSVVKDGENGFYVSGSVSDLAAKMLLFLSDVALQKRMAAAALDYIGAFDRTTLIREYANFLKEAAKTAHPVS